jgi:hypothetical protein
MKACSGSSGIAPLILNISTGWKLAVNFTSWMFCLHETVSGTNLIWGWMGPRPSVGPWRESNLGLSTPYHSHYIDCLIPANLEAQNSAKFIKNYQSPLLGIFWTVVCVFATEVSTLHPKFRSAWLEHIDDGPAFSNSAWVVDARPFFSI